MGYNSGCSPCSNNGWGGSNGCSPCGRLTMADYCGCSTTMAPVPTQLPSSSQIIVPVYGAIGYDSLVGDSCCGYSTLCTAYKCPPQGARLASRSTCNC